MSEVDDAIEGVALYLELAGSEEVPASTMQAPRSAILTRPDLRSRKSPYFRKVAHLNSAAIRVCTLYELLGVAQEHKVSADFYTPETRDIPSDEKLDGVRRELPRYIAFLLRDCTSHQEADSKSGVEYRKDKVDYLLALSCLDVDAALRRAFDELLTSGLLTGAST